jgi:metal-responsive CopG/Arc/MetJ family transcriptional regulator
MKRGTVTKNNARLINLYVPEELIAGLDEAIRHADTDRSKYIRAAVREKIARTRGCPKAQTPEAA